MDRDVAALLVRMEDALAEEGMSEAALHALDLSSQFAASPEAHLFRAFDDILNEAFRVVQQDPPVFDQDRLRRAGWPVDDTTGRV